MAHGGEVHPHIKHGGYKKNVLCGWRIISKQPNSHRIIHSRNSQKITILSWFLSLSNYIFNIVISSSYLIFFHSIIPLEVNKWLQTAPFIWTLSYYIWNSLLKLWQLLRTPCIYFIQEIGWKIKTMFNLWFSSTQSAAWVVKPHGKTTYIIQT